jgi:hypothetical protein
MKRSKSAGSEWVGAAFSGKKGPFFVTKSDQKRHVVAFFEGGEYKNEVFQGLTGRLLWHDLCYITG